MARRARGTGRRIGVGLGGPGIILRRLVPRQNTAAAAAAAAAIWYNPDLVGLARGETEREEQRPAVGCTCVLPRRSSNPLNDCNAVVGMVKSASRSDFGVCPISVGAPVGEKVAVAEAEAGDAAGVEKVKPEVVVAEEAGAARANKSAAVATEARANKKSAAAARANKKANKAAAAAEAAAKKPYPFPVPSEEYFNLWEDPKDREEIRASLTRIAELFAGTPALR